MSSRLRGLGVLVSTLAAAGCLANPDAGATGQPGSAPPPESSTSLSFRECGPLGSLGNGSCTGFDEYVACMDYECAAGYETCLGTGWKTSEYEGAVCEELMGCIEDAEDPCNHVCSATADCQSCLAGQLSACEAYCAELLDCSEAPASRSGACAELEACCMRQEAPLQNLCLLDLADVEATGDDGCSVLLFSYCAN